MSTEQVGNVYIPPVQRKAKVAHYVPEPEDNRSVMEILAEMSLKQPEKYQELVDKLIEEKGEDWIKNLRYDWSVNARPKQMMPEPRDEWRAAVWLAGRGFGKAACLDTPIPTVAGWTTMRDIKVGDKVLDEQGKKCKVTAVTDVFLPDVAYRLHFSDGSSIDVCSEHQWNTWTKKDRKAYGRSTDRLSNEFPHDWINWKSQNRVKTTQDIVDNLRLARKDKGTEVNHCIPNTRPLDLKEASLSVDPYILGAWLGDGSTKSGIGFTSADVDIVKEFELAGYKISPHKTDKYGWYVSSVGAARRNELGQFMSKEGSLHSQLKKLGLIYNKHIPQNYLRSSIDQRLSLLQGLMDTDGSVNKNGTCCEFTQSSKLLAYQVYELITSLGMSAKITSRVPKLNGKECKESWRITFVATMPVFRLDRKAKRLNFSRSQILKRYCRYIVKAEKIESKPMRCITVDSPNSMYLLGAQMLPTHNTRLGAEAIKQIVAEHKPGQPPLRIALVGATAADVNNVMIGGDSGIMSVYPEKQRPRWVGTNRKIYWYNDDGTERAIADCFSAEEPERLRGPQFHFAWCDELAAWRYKYAWDMLMFGLRLGDNPQVIVTTTPKPVPILLDVLKLESTWTTIGSTYENRSNLAPAFFGEIITKYEGTTLGRQELMAEIIEEIPNAMWNYDNLDKYRIDYDKLDTLPQFLSIVIAIDPATTTRASSAETGMCVAAYGEDDHFYILHLDAIKTSPEQWARKAIRLFEDYKCDKLIAEVNNGGDLVETVIKSINPMQKVYAVHASRGKITRAEPIASLYEQGRVHHVGRFSAGEEQMVTFNPMENPYGLKDMVDAMVWAMTWLVDTTQGRNKYAPAVGGSRQSLLTYKNRVSF